MSISISLTSLVWLIVGICVAYDFIKAFVYIGCTRFTNYMTQRRIQNIQEAIQRQLEKNKQ